MINFMNLVRPSVQSATPAPGAAGTPAAADAPLGLFAGIIKKLLEDIGQGTSGSNGTPASDGTLPAITAGKKVVGKEETAATVLEEEPRPVKALVKDGSAETQVVMLVPEALLNQIASLMPMPAAAMGVSTSPEESGAAGGSESPSAVAERSDVPSSQGNSLPLRQGGMTVPVNFATPFSSPETDGEMLLSLLSNAPPAANPSSGITGMPPNPVLPEIERELIPGQTLAGVGTANAETTIQPGNSVRSDQAIHTDTVAPGPIKLDMTAPDSPVAGPPKAPVADLASWFKNELKTAPLNPVPATEQGNDRATSQTPQVQSPSAPPAVTPSPAAITVETVDPSVILRAARVEPRKPVDTLSHTSKESEDTESVPEGGETPARSTGFFAGIVRDVLGAVTKVAGKPSSADLQADGSTSAPAVKSAGTPPDESVHAFADIQAQPAKKTAGPSQQEPESISASDMMRPTHDQVDLSAVRSSQAALNNLIGPDKSDPVGTAAPLRDIPSAYAPLPPEVSRRIADQVVQNLKLQVDGSISDIRMTLKPPSLGEVQLTVHVEDARMQAQIDVSQQVVKAALEAHMPQLRQALQEHGIEVQRIDVMLPEQSLQRDGAGANGDRTGRRGGRRSLDLDDPEAYQGAKDMGYNTIELIM